MIRTLFIVNPVSGKQTKRFTKDVIEKYIKGSFPEAEIAFTRYSEHATELVEKYLNEGVRRFIAFGGDGTINEVAKSLINTEAVLGIVPRGSGNGLARHLGIPLDMEKALKVIEQNNIKTIDFGTVNEIPFFCTSGVGFDAHIGNVFATSSKRGFITYFKKTVSEFFKYKSREYVLNLDGKEISRKAFLITLANASQYGNNAFIAPNADISDGFMDVVILKPFPLLVAPLLAVKLFSKKINKSRYVETFKCKEVKISNGRSNIIHLDGEPMNVESSLDIKITPAGLKVLV